MIREQLLPLISSLDSNYVKNRKYLAKRALNDSKADASVVKLAMRGHIVSGYIPFVKGQTKAQIYHFFSVNYGHRRTFAMNIALYGNDLNPIVSKMMDLGARKNVLIDIDEIFSNGNVSDWANTCVISLINERINANHAENEGHLRFWGVYGNDGAFVHSMPLPSSLNIIRSKFKIPTSASRRCYHPEAFFISNYAIFRKRSEILQRGELDFSPVAPAGYSVIQDKKSNVVGCWHTAGIGLFNKIFSDVEPYIVNIPPIKDIDGQLYFKECCSKGSVFTLQALRINPKNGKPECIFTTEIEPNLDAGVQLGEIIPAKILRRGVWLKLIATHGTFSNGPLNIVFMSHSAKKPLDCVHATRFRKVGNCLKFAPFVLDKGKQSWLSLNGSPNIDSVIRIRIMFLDNLTQSWYIIKRFKRARCNT